MYKQLLIAIPLVATPAVLIYFVAKYMHKPKKHTVEVLFFTGKTCHNHSNRNYRCNQPKCVYNNMLRMKDCIAEAKRSLDLCVSVIKVEDLAIEIIHAHQRGVKVRFIIDASKALSNDSKFEVLRKSGIHFHFRSSHVNYGFVIIDDEKIILCNLPWTVEGIFESWASVIIISYPTVVQSVMEEFKRMWEKPFKNGTVLKRNMI